MDWLAELHGAWAYAALFLTLYISGAGAPLPEEVPLAFGGYMIANGTCSLPGIAFVVTLALLTGDLTAYWLGRHFGMRVLTFAPFRSICTPERIEKVKRRFRENEGKALFFGRFFTGIRLATFIVAGMARVKLSKFIILDLLAAAVSAPIPVFIGYWLGDIDRAVALSRRIELVFAIGIVIGLVGTWYFFWRRPIVRDAAEATTAKAETSSDP
jgi:membrane protein DedA with SNARE-associated domain